MAEREGFEPSKAFTPYTLSKRAQSTTLPSLRKNSSRDAGLLNHEGFRVATHLTKSRRPNQMLPLLPSGPGGVRNLPLQEHQREPPSVRLCEFYMLTATEFFSVQDRYI